MAGYDYRRGMSKNAVDSYRRNIKPVSRFTAQDLRDAEVPISLGFARLMAQKKHWRPVAWHHSSKFYNKVNFYSLASLRRHIENLGNRRMDRLRQQYLRQLATRRRQCQTGRVPVRGEYAQWTGPPGKRHVAAWVPFQAELDGKGWVHLPDGSRRKVEKWTRILATKRRGSWRQQKAKKRRKRPPL